MNSFADLVEVIYPADKPLLVDMRWDGVERRMGLGDKVVAFFALQTGLAARSSHFDPLVRVSGRDSALARLAGFRQGEPGEEAGRVVIPWNHHVMEWGLPGTDPNSPDEACSHPVQRALLSLGWISAAETAPRCWPRLSPSEEAFRTAARLYAPGSYVTWNPVEVSRRRDGGFSGSLWAHLFRSLNSGRWVPILCGVTAETEAMARAEIGRLPESLRARVDIVRVELEVWLALMYRARACLTANTAGVWLGLGGHAPLYVLQRAATNPHQAMWNVKPEWGSLGGLHVLTVSAGNPAL